MSSVCSTSIASWQAKNIMARRSPTSIASLDGPTPTWMSSISAVTGKTHSATMSRAGNSSPTVSRFVL